MVTGETAGAIGYFIDGNRDSSARYAPAVERLFKVDGALAALNAAYWSKTLALTDVLDCMPQKRRDEWNKSITEQACPDFEEATVRATLESLLSSRSKFFAERVDGIFRNLSGEHITNSPAGFGKRMIIGYVLNDYYSVNHGRAGYINDLRAVIAKFMGRDEPKHYVSSRLIETMKNHWGEWVTVDGGALRIRLYKKGTAHLEVHPDMAWRLNSVLSSMYPAAIPEEFRRKPKKEKRAKEFQMIARPLPFAVLEILAGSMPRKSNVNTVYLSDSHKAGGSAAYDEACRILESIGGVKVGYAGSYSFDYWPGDVLNEIIVSGCIPDQKAHQYYPTPESIARVAIEMAQIGPGDLCLEPSAGQGGIADLMPMERTRCVEISALHCAILKAKGYAVDQADFITWQTGKFDRIVLNPPYSEGRWQAHLSHAETLLRSGGRLVAILPASAKGKDVLPGFACTWSRTFDGEFAGTGVSVAILAAERVAT